MAKSGQSSKSFDVGAKITKFFTFSTNIQLPLWATTILPTTLSLSKVVQQSAGSPTATGAVLKEI